MSRKVPKPPLARLGYATVSGNRPPAWTNVWICPVANGHLQATGRDARGRKQYRYHAKWRMVRDETKYDRVVAFGKSSPYGVHGHVIAELLE